MNYYLGVDVGGTKTHALIADEAGQALGFATGGPGNWEAVQNKNIAQKKKNRAATKMRKIP